MTNVQDRYKAIREVVQADPEIDAPLKDTLLNVFHLCEDFHLRINDIGFSLNRIANVLEEINMRQIRPNG